MDVDLISHQEGSDPAVAFDTVAAAKARNVDVFILDTANDYKQKPTFMAELAKVHRVVTKELGRPLDEVLLVVDATTGQNALSQANCLVRRPPLPDCPNQIRWNRKGGIVLALANELRIPVKLVGVGEQLTDLQDFDPKDFTDALFA